MRGSKPTPPDGQIRRGGGEDLHRGKREKEETRLMPRQWREAGQGREGGRLRPTSGKEKEIWMSQSEALNRYLYRHKGCAFCNLRCAWSLSHWKCR